MIAAEPIKKRRPGRPQVSDAAKLARHAPQVRGLRRQKQAAVEPAKPKPGRATRLSDQQIERICRTMVPGYCAWKTAGDGQWFDVDAARKAIDFFGTKLTHVKGAKARTPFYLRRWQMAIIGNLFGWKQANGKRRYRTTLIFVPRKNGKSPMAAGIILYLLTEDGEPGAEIYGAASEYQQASLVFHHARGMVLQNEDLSEQAKIYAGQQKSIQLGEETGFSTYRVVSSDSLSAHGWNTHGGLVDELHTQPNRDLVDALETSTGARAQPLLIYITTSDFDRESICNEKQDYAEKVRDGVIEDATFLPVLFMSSRDDDWEDRATWRKANPNLGVSVSMEYLEQAYRKAKETPSFENTFRRLHLNQRTEQDVRWLPLAAWDECADEPSCEGPCWAGLDLANTTDVAALVLVWRNENDGYDVRPYFWIPKENAAEREKRDRVPYLTWARQGYIELTEGNSIDYSFIRKRIQQLGEQYRIQEIGFDPWNATQLATQLGEDDGFAMIQFRQGFVSMNEPSKELERAVMAKEIRHGGNPVLRWMASNVSVRTDPAGNIKPDKQKSTEKIDGVVAMVMGIGRAMLSKGGSVYETRGLIVL